MRSVSQIQRFFCHLLHKQKKPGKLDFNTLTVCVSQHHACLPPWRLVGKRFVLLEILSQWTDSGSTSQVRATRGSQWRFNAAGWRLSTCAARVRVWSTERCGRSEKYRSGGRRSEPSCSGRTRHRESKERELSALFSWCNVKAESCSRMELLWISNSDEYGSIETEGEVHLNMRWRVLQRHTHTHRHTYVTIKSC